MTLLEAIQTVIDQLDGVRLPVRDGENANRIRGALALLEAMRDSANKPNDETKGDENNVENL